MALLKSARRIAGRLAAGCGVRRRPSAAPCWATDFSEHEIATIEAVTPYTMTSHERIVSLIRATEYVVRAGIPGDIVECGVWRGGSMMAVARTLLRMRDTGRRLLLFDTFEGMPPPSVHDYRSQDGRHASEVLGKEDRAVSLNWAVASLDVVRKAMVSTGYPGPIEFIRGKVEETIPRTSIGQIALLRLDTDWYESTACELRCLYPSVARGGVLIIDDFGHWDGARRATEEYFSSSPVLLSRIDSTGRLAVKL